ncbi:MAG: FCD domain-containing protein, partial [Lachnospiraceae bacterium]|nr:FCD domain-containing protein [Lachnospiraceae bacterium]
YHMAIVKMTENPMMIKAYDILRNVLKDSMISVIEKMKYKPALCFHRKILDAMKKKDAELAEKLMHEHIGQNYKYFK